MADGHVMEHVGRGGRDQPVTPSRQARVAADPGEFLGHVLAAEQVNVAPRPCVELIADGRTTTPRPEHSEQLGERRVVDGIRPPAEWAGLSHFGTLADGGHVAAEHSGMTLAVRRNLSGPELQARRRDAEATQEQVAAILVVNRSRIAAIEAMAAPNPRAARRYLAALAEIETARE
jgi:DNA-binding XRE family transcriptional regulator